MRIDHKNKKIIDKKINIHDSIFEGFSYDEGEKILLLKLKNYCLNKIFKLQFCNILVMNCEMCQFWGQSPNILNWEVSDEEKLIKDIMKKQNNNKELYRYSIVNTEEAYIETIITLTSGDTISTVCEYIEFQEEILDEYKDKWI